jgi:hypothetical protein
MRNAGFIAVHTHDRNEDKRYPYQHIITQPNTSIYYYKNNTQLALFFTFCKPDEDPSGQNMQQFYKTKVTVFVIKIVVLDCSIYVLLIYEMQYVLCH